MAPKGRTTETTFQTPVVALLKPNWQFDAEQGVFRAGKGRVFSPWGSLPADSQIVPLAPRLAKLPKAELSAAERRLARYIHVVPPATVPLAQIVTVVETWPSVFETHVGPHPALPGSAATSSSPPVAAAPAAVRPVPVVPATPMPDRSSVGRAPRG